MTDRQRADIGFSDALDTFDPADWTPARERRARPASADTRKVADATGFRSREARAPDPEPARAGPQPAEAERPAEVQQRRRRTGRNAQFNLKARPDTIARFCAIADAQGWGLGETLEHAVDLLERQQAAAVTAG